MCLSAALVGVIVVLRKQSLLGEALSHASYPGLILGVLCASLLEGGDNTDIIFTLGISTGAFLSALLGLAAIRALERQNVHSDAALCFVLSCFFGVGITLVSRIQFTHTALYRQAQAFLYGQTATMTDTHIIIYSILCIAVIFLTVLFQKELQVITFNLEFAKSIGIPVKVLDRLFACLTALAIVIGIRSVGVVLMTAMIISPVVTARQYTHSFKMLALLASLFGMLAAFFGNYLSISIADTLSNLYPGTRIAIPTGPTIVLFSSTLCLVSLLVAPKQGLLPRVCRVMRFRYKRVEENVLKTIWRLTSEAGTPDKKIQASQNKMTEGNLETENSDGREIAAAENLCSYKEIANYQSSHRLYLQFILSRLIAKGWVEKISQDAYTLTLQGRQRAEYIVRLHRLWELYLADYLGVGVDKVHRDAEEMEHILTPEIEQQLTLLLRNPQKDPHEEQIPEKGNF
jgi:manganese/zinc/iron transport system permease protein